MVTASDMGKGRKAKNWQPCEVVALEGNSVRDAAILWLEQKGASHSSLMSSTLGRVTSYVESMSEYLSEYLSDRTSNRPAYMSDRLPEYMSDGMSEKKSDRLSEYIECMSKYAS